MRQTPKSFRNQKVTASSFALVCDNSRQITLVSQPGQCLYLQQLSGSKFLNYSISRMVQESTGKSMRTP